MLHQCLRIFSSVMTGVGLILVSLSSHSLAFANQSQNVEYVGKLDAFLLVDCKSCFDG